MFNVSLVTYKHSFCELQQLITSVLASGCRSFYIVDNANDQELAAELAKLNEVRLQYILSPGNIGFGSAHNLAIRRSLAEKVRYHMIVNPDISFQAGTLEKIVNFMESDQKTGLVMPKTLSLDGQLQRNCKLLPSPLDLISKRFLPGFLTRRRMKRFMMYKYDHDQILDVPYLCGCFMSLRCSALEKAGLFDERFFMYPEDIDITRRIFAADYRTVYYPYAEVIHAHEQASYKSMKMLTIHIKNMIRYFNKWGWLFDAERRAVNQQIIKLNASKLLKK